MTRLTEQELTEMRDLATQGYAPSWGSLMDEPAPDPVIPLRRSEIAMFQRMLLRAVEELEEIYTRPPAEQTP
jgi:hypothetical protein